MGASRPLVLLTGSIAILCTHCAQIDDEEATLAASSALTEVSWKGIVGVDAVGNALTKTAGAGFNAGAISKKQLNGDGYLEFTTGENNTDKMVGLSNGNTDEHYADIDFAFYLTGAGMVLIYESGVYQGASCGAYSAGDTFRVQVIESVVTYYKNSSLCYTSAVAPTLPLVVDTSLFTTGATVQDAVTDGLLTPSFWQNEGGVSVATNNLTKTGGTGFNAGASTIDSITIDSGYAEFTTAEADTDKMAGLSNGDSNHDFYDIDYTFYLTAAGQVLIYEGGTYRGAVGGYAAGDIFRLTAESGVVHYYQNDELVYTSSVSPTLPLLLDTSLYTTGATIEDVVVAETPFWQNVKKVSSAGANLTKTGEEGWNAGASTTTSFSADGYVEFTTAEADTEKIAGLSNGDSNEDLADIDFAFYLRADGQAEIYEGGTSKATVGVYAAGDIFRLTADSGVVQYYHNDALIYTSAVAPTMPLLLDTSLYTPGATIQNVLVAAGSIWQNEHGVSCSGVDLTKTGTAGWNAGASSIMSFSGDGYAQFTTAEADTDKMAGLSHGDSNLGYADIDYAFFLTGAGTVLIYEGGLYRTTVGAYSAGDTFRLEVQSAQVIYYHNGNPIYTSAVIPTMPLLFDTSLYSPGATVSSVAITTL